MSRRLVAVSDWLYVKTASVLALVVLAALAIAIATVLLVMVLLALPVAAGLLAIFATIQGAKWVLVDHRERRRAADLGRCSATEAGRDAWKTCRRSPTSSATCGRKVASGERAHHGETRRDDH
jgi:uncharacterized membrane protein YgcG